MSFSRTISRIVDKKDGKIRAISLVDALDAQVLNPRKVSKKKLLRIARSLYTTLKDNEISEALEIFSELYSQMMLVRERPQGVFHPSSLETDCPRCLWHDIHNTPKTDEVYTLFSPQTLMTFDQGTWFHLYAQQKLKDAGILIKAEVQVKNDDWKVDGLTDGDIRIPEKALLEIKTMNSFQYKKACITNKPFESHVKQASLYAHFKGYEWIVFLYFNKDTSDKKEFVYKVDKSIIEKSLQKMELILKSKTPPKCTHPTQCACAWRSLKDK